MILVDTSVWVDHLRLGDDRLASLLEACEVATHPLVIGELAVGTLAERDVILDLMGRLPRLPVADAGEVLALIASRDLHGRGLGIVDVHLLASVLLVPGTELWTRDRALARAAQSLSVAWDAGPP